MARDELLHWILGAVPEHLVLEDLRLGLHWTVATTATGAGVAAAFRDRDFGQDERPVEGAGRLLGRPLAELVPAGLEGGLSSRSVALAALAAGLPRGPIEAAPELNARDLIIRHGRSGPVLMVGHFLMVDWLRDANLDLRVFELPGRLRPGDLPSSELPAHLPEAAVLAITATTLLTGTLEGILERCSRGTRVILMGPTAPLSTRLFDAGIHHVCGVRVEDPQEALVSASQGASIRQMGGQRRVCLTAEGW